MAVFAGRQGEVKATNGYYVGNGHVGVDYPCSITFEKLPNKIVVEVDPKTNMTYKLLIILPGILTNEFKPQRALIWNGKNILAADETYAKCDGKTVSWYSSLDAFQQMNVSGVTYKWWTY